MSEEVDSALHKANVAAQELARSCVKAEQAFEDYLDVKVFGREVIKRRDAYLDAHIEYLAALERWKVAMEDGLPKEAA